MEGRKTAAMAMMMKALVEAISDFIESTDSIPEMGLIQVLVSHS